MINLAISCFRSNFPSYITLFLHCSLLCMSMLRHDYDFQAVLETVAKITHEKMKRNDTQEAKYGNA